MFFKKKKENDSLDATKNWYEDRYQTVVVQRNFLIILIVLATLGITVATLGIIEVTASKKIEPFVIEIEEKSGITNVIRPFLMKKISTDEAIKNYFLHKYVMARESYNPATYRRDYYTTVKLLSDTSTYNLFKGQLRSDEINAIQSSIAGRGRLRKIEILSITDRTSISRVRAAKGADKDNQTYMVTFTATTQVAKSKEVQRLFSAIVDFRFEDLKLTMEELSVNPLGFRVYQYTVNPETYVNANELRHLEAEE